MLISARSGRRIASFGGLPSDVNAVSQGVKPVPQGWLKIGRDAILDNPQPSLRDSIRKSWFSHTLFSPEVRLSHRLWRHSAAERDDFTLYVRKSVPQRLKPSSAQTSYGPTKSRALIQSISAVLATDERYRGQILAAALPACKEEVVHARPGMIAEVVGFA
jgi:hypothetical protein